MRGFCDYGIRFARSLLFVWFPNGLVVFAVLLITPSYYGSVRLSDSALFDEDSPIFSGL